VPSLLVGGLLAQARFRFPTVKFGGMRPVELPVDDPKRSTGHEQLRKALEHVARQTTAPPSPSIAQSGTHDVIDKVPTSPQ
jgi:hypothetical protein